jgi:ATP-dependent helicase/DNAse subunit B
VAAEIARLIAGGMAPEEIALAVRSPGLVAELLAEVLGAAGVPYALQRRRRLADSAIGAALIGLLRSVPRAGGGGPAGTVGDLLAWLRAPGLLELPALADRLERDARRHGLASAAQARALWEERHWQLDAIEQLAEAQGGSPAGLIDRAARELSRLLGAPRGRSASVLAADEADEARAHATARRALEELRELGELEPALVPGEAWALAEELAAVEFVSGEPPTAGAVAVSDPLALRARRVRALFLCGLQEGVFPARPRRQGLLADEERRQLAEASGLLLGGHEDALAAERYLLYAAVSRPEELLVLSWHVADDDGAPTARSLFVEDVCDLFEEDLLEHPRRRALGARGAISGGGASREGPPEGFPTVRRLPSSEEALRDERVLAQLRERTWSASQLESLISCPVRWFVERVLRPGAYDPDAEPLRRGALAHAVLNDTLEELRAQTGSALPTPANLSQARELLRTSLAERERELSLSAAPERLPGARLRLASELERYLEFAAGLQCGLSPGPLELAFGFTAEEEEGAGEELPAFDLGGGVMLRGRIDRVDLSPGGEAVVLDYKSGNAAAPGRWIGDGKVQVALYMLAVESLLGYHAAGGFYQPLSGSDLRARGVLEEDSGIELECVRGDVRPREEVRELLEQALALARSAAERARRGELEARPQTCSPNGCSYPSICRCRP